MKLKYDFVVRNVGGSPVAVAVGDSSADFNGMIRLGGSGEFIFNMLMKGSDVDSIVSAVCGHFSAPDESEVRRDVEDFIGSLRNAGLIEE